MAKAAQRSGRSPRDITLVAVTKTISLETIQPFLKAGVRSLGENRVQEALAKYANSDGAKMVEADLHLVGQLQSNKAKKAAKLFDMVQSLDRLDLAQDLNRHAGDLAKKLPCLVEVKISPEASKSGVLPDQVVDFLAQLTMFESLEIRGLMGVAPGTTTAEETRPFFSALRKLFEQTKLSVLSMGMSADFEIAIEEGSTMVRVGTALFGERLATP